MKLKAADIAELRENIRTVVSYYAMNRTARMVGSNLGVTANQQQAQLAGNIKISNIINAAVGGKQRRG